MNKPENLKELFKLTKKFKYIIGKFMPNIQFRRKIYVKKELPPINRKYIEKLINFMKGEKIQVNSIHSPRVNNNKNNITEEYLPIMYRD